MDNATVRFRYDTAHFTLSYPKAITDLPQANLRKLFKFMVSDWHREANADAVRVTHDALTAYAAETKKVWAEASKNFQNGYVDTKYHYCPNKRAAAANNKRLMEAVKSAKSKYERAQKLLTFFEEVKEKYFN